MKRAPGFLSRFYAGATCLIFIGTCWGFTQPPHYEFSSNGPVQTVYSFKRDGCDKDNAPDAAAHAFRDYRGIVHLIISAPENRAMTGADLNSLKMDCRVIYSSVRNADPSKFDDLGWVESVFTDNGRDIYAMVSMDYHPYRHNARCGNSPAQQASCWYSAIVLAKSTDGGRSFTSPSDVRSKFVAGPARPFDPDLVSTVGALVPSNIIRFQGNFYVLIWMSLESPERSVECLFRSTELRDATSWKAWDGKDFSAEYASPFSTSKTSNTCAPLTDITHPPARSLVIVPGGFMIVEFDSGGKSHNSAIVAQTSTDLIHWSQPVEVLKVPVFIPNSGIKGERAYYYPSLIDSSSKSLSFETVGATADIYLTQYIYGGGMNRDVVRFPVRMVQQ